MACQDQISRMRCPRRSAKGGRWTRILGGCRSWTTERHGSWASREEVSGLFCEGRSVSASCFECGAVFGSHRGVVRKVFETVEFAERTEDGEAVDAFVVVRPRGCRRF